jgi:hypothetical protein
MEGLEPCALLRSEALALLSRLQRVQPFSLQETMVAAAAPSVAALRGIEGHIADSIAALVPAAGRFVAWMDGCPPPELAQEQFALLRLRFNLFLDRFDVYSDVITQRSEQPAGVWLAGLDALAEDLLAAGVGAATRPPLVCYLTRGRGAAIRRARTRFPDGEMNPVGIVRLPRERMIGSGIASSLAHEVGHQGAALLDLIDPAREALRRLSLYGPWGDWVSEIVSDFWASACLGISATVGLLAVVTLPSAFVFRLNEDDVHPAPYLRTLLSVELGQRLYPDPQWRRLADTWQRLYPLANAPVKAQPTLARQVAEIPAVARALTSLRFPSLGATLQDHLGSAQRSPAALRGVLGARLQAAAPGLAIAALGQARADGTLAPEAEARLLDSLLRRWALRRSGVTRFTMPSNQGEHHVRLD